MDCSDCLGGTCTSSGCMCNAGMRASRDLVDFLGRDCSVNIVAADVLWSLCGLEFVLLLLGVSYKLVKIVSGERSLDSKASFVAVLCRASERFQFRIMANGIIVSSAALSTCVLKLCGYHLGLDAGVSFTFWLLGTAYWISGHYYAAVFVKGAISAERLSGTTKEEGDKHVRHLQRLLTVSWLVSMTAFLPVLLMLHYQSYEEKTVLAILFFELRAGVMTIVTGSIVVYGRRLRTVLSPGIENLPEAAQNQRKQTISRLMVITNKLGKSTGFEICMSQVLTFSVWTRSKTAYLIPLSWCITGSALLVMLRNFEIKAANKTRVAPVPEQDGAKLPGKPKHQNLLLVTPRVEGSALANHHSLTLPTTVVGTGSAVSPSINKRPGNGALHPERSTAVNRADQDLDLVSPSHLDLVSPSFQTRTISAINPELAVTLHIPEASPMPESRTAVSINLTNSHIVVRLVQREKQSVACESAGLKHLRGQHVSRRSVDAERKGCE